MKLLRLVHFLLLFALFLTSCIVPESTHIAPQFFLLSSSSKEEKVEGLNGISFYIKEVELPSYLIDNRLVFRPHAESLEFRENIRWGEPLEEGIGRVIGQNLSDLSGSLKFSVFPHRQKVSCDWEIGITVVRFEKNSSKTVVLKAFWEIEKSTGFSQRLSFEQEFPIQGTMVRDEVYSMSEALHGLSSTIAEALQSVSQSINEKK